MNGAKKFLVVGGLLGYGARRFIGCSSGACLITSNPWVSSIFELVIGGLFAAGF
jgi:hypothetical protein